MIKHDIKIIDGLVVGRCERSDELERIVRSHSGGKEEIIKSRKQTVEKYQLDSILGKYSEWFVYNALPSMANEPDMEHYRNGNREWTDLAFEYGGKISVKSCRAGRQISWVFQADIDKIEEDWFAGIMTSISEKFIVSKFLVFSDIQRIKENLRPLRNKNLTGKLAYYYE